MGGIKLIFASILFCQLCIIINAQFTYRDTACSDTISNDTKIYTENVNLLFSNLISKSSNLSFYNSRIGDDSNKVYGLFQCRYNISTDNCAACVMEASKKIPEDCPSKNQGIIWYSECMLRYANYDISSFTEMTPWSFHKNDSIVSDGYESDKILFNTMDDIIKTASRMSPHFAFNTTNWTSSRQLYSFAQCTPDIDRVGCSTCLKNALLKTRDCCNISMSTMIFMPSCQLRYDTSPFLKDYQSPPSSPSKQANSRNTIIGIIVAIAVCVPFALIVVLAILWIRLFRRRRKGASSGVPLVNQRGLHDGAVNGDVAYNLGEIEFMEYDFATLKNATRNFSNENALGEGGFGIVYKGTLENGRPLAIKRLSVASGLSRNDFMSTVDLLAELRHSNIARLVGFCSEGEEKLLVYEFMSNTSLDRFLFDPRKRPLLSWLTRYNIILGIAKGLLYLHEDSHLSIVHGALKPNNILLDRDMNPKITDFGLGKLLDVEQVPRRNTSRIVRTKGYVAPENKTLGTNLKESDVYSFGIMLLEIVSGQKNRLFNRSPQNEDLPIHAWRLWNDGRPFDLTDPALYNNCSSSDVIKCIQIGLLCVQANVDERPTMPTVVMMLSGYADIPLPSAQATSSHQFDSVSDSYSDDQQSDPDQSAAKTVTWRTEFEQDLYPRPR